MNKLHYYIGHNFNEDTKAEIEKNFYPYVVSICDINVFNQEDFWENQIRCLVVNGKIDKLQFN